MDDVLAVLFWKMTEFMSIFSTLRTNIPPAEEDVLL